MLLQRMSIAALLTGALGIPASPNNAAVIKSLRGRDDCNVANITRCIDCTIDGVAAVIAVDNCTPTDEEVKGESEATGLLAHPESCITGNWTGPCGTCRGCTGAIVGGLDRGLDRDAPAG
ncbi:hypothetical protein GQ53DRAFT_773749 [Thozetella sp. PMI_491]|nr:hypothetical protein GQ53DRAFT_773749 [Thozetella sp. PMI_491]